MTSTVSVVAIAHDVERYVDDLVGGFHRNAAEDVEFVIVDDGSTDSTGERLAELVEELPGGRLLHHEVARGPSAARNTGIAHAQGDLLVLVDGDDWIATGYVDALRRRILELGVDALRTGHVRDHAGRREVVLPPCHRLDQALDPRSEILPPERKTLVDFPFPHSAMFSRRLVDRGLLRFDEDLRTAEDREWAWRVMTGAESMAVSHLPGYFYRRGVTGALTQVGDERQLDFIASTRSTVEHLRSTPGADRFLPKARRSQLALVYFHHQKRSRLPRPLRAQLRTRTHELLREIPWPEFWSVARSMGPTRRSFLTARRRGVV